ncbi:MULTISPECIES: CHAP domain-containing protein [Sphingomonas]|uniref:CHAP domain-containing protein n=1 Tax=Sphingomonas lycopersici TaxID=2951807 RepID=A0AA42CTP4_9SPHN|nr:MULTISPECIES: CHAP domain-containing protein [unclassified Sphingomonas]MCW6529474.1 CHAP domain-containing protein [Sphingomonas lycopersici]MCW6534603.1 CHAP domain-containing protein [Sphingomonas lycopersici]
MLKRFAIGVAGVAALFGVAPASAGSLLDYVGQCVPFARAASGIQIYGDAWTWWDQADGKYPRGHVPRVGAVIAFAKQSRLPLGHVAVVSRIVEKRVLMLTHANWSRVNGARGHAEQDVTLYDVSPRNDWSEVKVWYRDSDGLGGTIYDVNGFIYAPGRPSPELTAHNPDYVGALIDAYVPDAGHEAR